MRRSQFWVVSLISGLHDCVSLHSGLGFDQIGHLPCLLSCRVIFSLTGSSRISMPKTCFNCVCARAKTLLNDRL